MTGCSAVLGCKRLRAGSWRTAPTAGEGSDLSRANARTAPEPRAVYRRANWGNRPYLGHVLRPTSAVPVHARTAKSSQAWLQALAVSVIALFGIIGPTMKL